MGDPSILTPVQPEATHDMLTSLNLLNLFEMVGEGLNITLLLLFGGFIRHIGLEVGWALPMYLSVFGPCIHHMGFVHVFLSDDFNIYAGSLCDFKNTLVHNVGFLLEVMSLLMVLGHYLQIWWLRGMAFHLVDAILLLNMRVNFDCSEFALIAESAMCS